MIPTRTRRCDGPHSIQLQGCIGCGFGKLSLICSKTDREDAEIGMHLSMLADPKPEELPHPANETVIHDLPRGHSVARDVAAADSDSSSR